MQEIVSLRFSESSKSSITAALGHWRVVCDKYMWPEEIVTGDPSRGAKLVCFVLALMAFEREPGVFYPASTITNYVWALCAHMQSLLYADPRVNVVGWKFFMAAVTVLCFVPYEPRKRVPTESIRSALAAVDLSCFESVQMALFVLVMWYTFQRSEFPCPKTYNGMDSAKHMYVRHVEPYEGGFRFAVGSTKADPRAERLSGDAGPGREWVVVGEVDDPLFDLRLWFQRFLAFFPEGPRDPDSPFFRCPSDRTRPLIYHTALDGFRRFLTGHIDDPQSVGIHGVRSEGFIVCSNAVGEEAAVIQGGWRGLVSASRYDRLTRAVQLSMASDMVKWSRPASDESVAAPPLGSSGSAGTLGIVARRAAAKSSNPSRRRQPLPADAAQQAPTAGASRPRGAMPPGWRRVWHSTSGRKGGYASFVGPDGRHARSIAQAQGMVATQRAHAAAPARASAPVAPLAAPSRASNITVDNLVDHVTEFDRPPTRRPPTVRVVPR